MGLSDLGDGLSWGEAKLLIEEAAADPSTALGAELSGWAYPASIPVLLSLSAQVGDWKVARKLMPWVMAWGQEGQKATPDEVAAATAELEDGIVFAT